MRNDDPLNAFGARFYQGIADDVADWGELASLVLEGMTLQERDALRTYLQDVLERLTSSEIKGKLNRTMTDYAFNSKSAVAFLKATAGQLAHDP